MRGRRLRRSPRALSAADPTSRPAAPGAADPTSRPAVALGEGARPVELTAPCVLAQDPSVMGTVEASFPSAPPAPVKGGHRESRSSGAAVRRSASVRSRALMKDAGASTGGSGGYGTRTASATASRSGSPSGSCCPALLRVSAGAIRPGIGILSGPLFIAAFVAAESGPLMGLIAIQGVATNSGAS